MERNNERLRFDVTRCAVRTRDAYSQHTRMDSTAAPQTRVESAVGADELGVAFLGTFETSSSTINGDCATSDMLCRPELFSFEVGSGIRHCINTILRLYSSTGSFDNRYTRNYIP